MGPKSDKRAGELNRLFRITFRKGRRRAAFVIDTAFAFLILVLVLWIIVRPHFKNRTAAALVTASSFSIILCSCIIIDRERYARHIVKLEMEARLRAAETKLLLDPSPALDEIHRTDRLKVFRGADSLTADDLLLLIKECEYPLTVVTAAAPTEKARSVMAALPGKVEVVSPAQRLGERIFELYPVSREEAEEAIIKEHSELLKKPDIKAVFALTRERAFRYFSVGAGLLLLSFFVKRGLYFRAVASICFGLGGAAAIRDAAAKKSGTEKGRG
ncbi:MAG: hypothetical protein J5772_06670 [Clostridia bacterium]|nr:hypothetical protein [Clostridia bacterium]